MRETQSPQEGYADWKAPESGAETAPEQAEALSAETPEGLIEAVPEEERGVLRRMGEKIFGKRAIEEVATSIRAQAELMRELGSGVKKDGVTWKGIDKKRAGFYATYAMMGAVAAELGSPDSAEAEEGDAHDAELKQIMYDAMPHTPGGNILTSEQLSESQKIAFLTTYELRRQFVEEGGTPAQYEMQVEDIWDVQKELEGEKSYYEKSREEAVAGWCGRILEQYGKQSDLDERQIRVLDSTVGAVDAIDGVTAQERIIFKDAAIRAIQESGNDGDALRDKLTKLLRVTEAVQNHPDPHQPQNSENFHLERLYDQVLSGDTGPNESIKRALTEDNPFSESSGGTPEERRGQTTEQQEQESTEATQNLGIEIPTAMELEFSDKYNGAEQGQIQEYVNINLEELQEMDSQFSWWENKYGHKSEFQAFEDATRQHIEGELTRLQHIVEDVKDPNAGKVRAIVQGYMPAETMAGMQLDILSSKVKLRTVEEAANDAFSRL